MNEVLAIPQAALEAIGAFLSQPHIVVMIVAVSPWIALAFAAWVYLTIHGKK